VRLRDIYYKRNLWGSPARPKEKEKGKSPFNKNGEKWIIYQEGLNGNIGSTDGGSLSLHVKERKKTGLS